MALGWGIFAVVIAFSIGVVVGAIALGAFAMKAAIKAGKRSDPEKSDDMREKIDIQWTRVQERIERIKKMRTEIEEMAKTAPKPIPSIRPMRCDDCGREWHSMSIVSECPGCRSKSVRAVGTVTEIPFIGEPS